MRSYVLPFHIKPHVPAVGLQVADEELSIEIAEIHFRNRIVGADGLLNRVEALHLEMHIPCANAGLVEIHTAPLAWHREESNLADQRPTEVSGGSFWTGPISG